MAPLLDGVVAGLPSRPEFDTQEARRLVLGHLARDPEGLARQLVVLPRQRFGVAEDFQHTFVVHAEVRVRPGKCYHITR